ncbi:MAG: hypothetical protein KJO35_08355 [Gammaproteobacteria bacterium]|nr:hypothetical protein [Gammaproteobacteria bacterium]
MDLDFQKEKQRIADMSDAELIAQLRNPKVSATDRMLIEAEISRRGISKRNYSRPGENLIERKKRSNPIGLLIFVVVFLSILTTILEDMGIDLVQWLRDFFLEK